MILRTPWDVIRSRVGAGCIEQNPCFKVVLHAFRGIRPVYDDGVDSPLHDDHTNSDHMGFQKIA